MVNIIYYIVFLFVTVYILLKAIGYGLYEIKENNKIGGICVIFLSIIVIIFANIMLLLS